MKRQEHEQSVYFLIFHHIFSLELIRKGASIFRVLWIHHNLFITLLLGSKAKTMLANQPCCIETNMFRLFFKPSYNESVPMFLCSSSWESEEIANLMWNKYKFHVLKVHKIQIYHKHIKCKCYNPIFDW